MPEFKFKSSGFKKTDSRFTHDRDSVPIGIKTPLKKGRSRTGLLDMHFVPRDQIADNLRNLILTNYGERIGRYDFGSNVRPLALEVSNQDDFEKEAMLRISSAVSRFMPFVELDTFEVTINNDAPSGMSKITLRVGYNVTKYGIIGQGIEVIFFVAG